MEEIKLKVTMKNETVSDEEGKGWTFVATDFVPESELEAYVADAKLRWAEVTVEELPQEN